jgi:hypothetical protein
VSVSNERGGADKAALLRLWREKRGEVEPEDLTDNLIVQLGLVTGGQSAQNILGGRGAKAVSKAPKPIFGVEASAALRDRLNFFVELKRCLIYYCVAV